MGQWSENKVWRLILAPSNIGYKYLLLPRRLFGKAPVQQPNLTEQNSVYERNRRKFVQVEVHSEFESLLLAENEGHAAVTQTRSRSAQTFPAAAHSAVAARCCLLLLVAVCCCPQLCPQIRLKVQISSFTSSDDVRNIPTVDWLPELPEITDFRIFSFKLRLSIIVVTHYEVSPLYFIVKIYKSITGINSH